MKSVGIVAYLFVDEGHPIEELSMGVDLAAGIAMLIWGFAARTRANELFCAESGGPTYFSGLWTFLFTPLYFNYRMNAISDRDYPV